jgi:hypothetical protein
MESASQGRPSAAENNPLRDAGILEQVFTFLPGHWLFLGAVGRAWEAVYTGMEDQQVCSVSLYDNNKLVTCCCKTTVRQQQACDVLLQDHSLQCCGGISCDRKAGT